mmetsp:Transcript_25424/g.73338  ORF Transcript_25424/g.73338 Transcript_25424/m.73338 type:complete len:305 (-) Transcript_25424:237-1151(-)
MSALETPPSKYQRIGGDDLGCLTVEKASPEPAAAHEHASSEADDSESADGGEEELGEDGDSEIEAAALCCQWTPNQVRARVRKLLQQTDIKVAEFQRMLQVDANSYNSFMNGKYKDQWMAAENLTFEPAVHFFLRERRLGKEAIGKTRARNKGKTGGSRPFPNISAVTTDGLTYLTPGETRRELSKLLKGHEMSLAALARLAGVPAQSLTQFCKAGGDFGAAGNRAYRPAAELVEKVRVALKMPKSKKRLGLEAEVAAGRVEPDGQPFLGVNPKERCFCLAGDRPVLVRDALGRRVVEYRGLKR